MREILTDERGPRAIATARDALSNDQHESAVRFEGSAKQALVLATKPRAKREARSILYHTCQLEPEQLLAIRGVASATTSICACARY